MVPPAPFLPPPGYRLWPGNEGKGIQSAVAREKNQEGGIAAAAQFSVSDRRQVIRVHIGPIRHGRKA